MFKFAVAFALIVFCTLASAPRAELSPPPPSFTVGGNSAPAPAAENFSVGTEMVCIDGKCYPRSQFRLASAGGDCSSSSQQRASSDGCSSSSRAAFPVARAFGAGLYGITHPRTWFPRLKASRAAGCGG